MDFLIRTGHVSISRLGPGLLSFVYIANALDIGKSQDIVKWKREWPFFTLGDHLIMN